MRRKHLYYLAIAIMAGLMTQSYLPIQKQQRKARQPKRYTLQSYEENDFPGYQKRVHALPQYKLWVKRRNNMKLWEHKYASLHLPDTAVIIDEKIFNTPKGKRTIVAWMTDENVDYNVYEYEEAYASCPSSTVGTGYFSGKLHFTLVNTGNCKLINSIYLTSNGEYEDGAMIYPFSIANPKINSKIFRLLYAANGGTDSTDGEADIMRFFDFNNDGKSYEFALFITENCASVESTLISYNDKKDSLIWQNWDMTFKFTTEKFIDTMYNEKVHWMGHTMRANFSKDGTLNYYESYLGRGGSFEKYYLRYDKNTDTYSGILDGRLLAEDTSGKPTLPDIRQVADKKRAQVSH